MLLLEPSNFSFITRPTKGWLRVVGDRVATVKGFRFANTPELGSPRGFHLWLSHGLLLWGPLAPPALMERTPSATFAKPGVPELNAHIRQRTKGGVGDIGR